MRKWMVALAAMAILAVSCMGTPAAVTMAEGFSFAEEGRSAEIGQTIVLHVQNAQGETQPGSAYQWKVSPKDAAIVKNGRVTFLQAGSVTVTAELNGDASQSVNAQFTVSKSVYSEEGSLNYSFTNVLAMNKFDANFVPDNTGMDAGSEEWRNHWSLNTDQGWVERINDFGSDVSSNVASLYFKNKKMSCFEATLLYQSVTGSSGWIGFVSNNNDLTKRGIDSGLASFVQSDGKPTFWGPLVGSAVREKANPGYEATGWHVMKLRMLSGRVEMYIDDMEEAAYSYSLSDVPAEGYLGVMTSGTGFRIRKITASYLTAAGEKIPYRKVDTFVLPEKITSAVVGQTIVLNPQIQPENATVQSFGMTSSNSNICIAKNGKLVFIAEGEVDITVYSDDDPSLVEELKITVSRNPDTPEPGSGSHPAPDASGGNGCASANAAGMALTICFAALSAAGIAVIAVLKSKSIL